MEQEVTWVMHLKDLFTSKIKDADHAAQHLEGTMHGAAKAAGSFGKQMVGAITAAFSMYEGLEFVKSSVEDFHQLEQANAQVKAGLESTGFAAGLTFKDLEDDAISFAEQVKYSRGELSDMQAQLLTFPSVSKAVFHDAEQSIMDMATRMHHGLDETAIQVGKALQDPIHGITALHKAGVNFSDAQKEVIKHLVKTGQAAQAQAIILHELQTEFAGSAKAAADADPLHRYHKIMEDIHYSVGGAAVELLQFFVPAINAVANAIKSSIDWMKQHREITLAIAGAVGVVVSGLIIYETVMKANIIATKLLTVGQWLFNASLWACPITWIVAGLTLVVAAVIYCYKHFAIFRGIIMGVWETIKEFGRVVADIFMGLGKVIAGVLTFNPAMVVEGAKQTIDAIYHAADRMGNAAQAGFSNGLADFAKDHAGNPIVEGPSAMGPPTRGAFLGHKPAKDNQPPKEPARATGSKNVTIHVQIQQLVGKVENHVTTLSGGIKNMKEQVVAALLSAVNDSTIVAGQ